MRHFFTRITAAGTALALLVAVAAGAADKIRIEKLDDLPRHTYTIGVKAADLLKNDTALVKLASEVKRDLEADLAAYDIQDKNTLKDCYGALGSIAALEKDFDGYLKNLELSRQLEDKEGPRLTAGLFLRAYIKAAASGAPDPEVIKREYAALLGELPYDKVEADLKEAKARYEIYSENLVIGMVESRVQPQLDQSNGVMSKDVAIGLVRNAFMLRYLMPYKSLLVETLTAYLDAHKVQKADIWAEREATLKDSDPGKPVIVAIWDSGVDTDVFPGKLWTNSKETPGNGIDDDKNGFVDDVHGIAFTLHADKTPDLLYPIGDVAGDRSRLQKQSKGLSDIEANVESEEATALKKELSSMDKAQVKPFIEGIIAYGNHAHGTHVAGIASLGNPFIRMLAASLTFGATLIPETPTIEQARKDSVSHVETVEYFKKAGVRVVNMSWGGDLASIEKDLEANNAGGTPEERKALARQIFEIDKQALYNAFKSAPDILFVTAAGNEDNDVRFDEVIPSSFDLPNIITVGAVDQAGDETSFTSFGKVDVYANGFEVLSYVPGGDQLKMSGTSMSSPNAVNLAAKLLALRPSLTPTQVRQLMIDGCDERTSGERKVRLLNPKKSMELLVAMK
jgi:subtilisin family serine protease